MIVKYMKYKVSCIFYLMFLKILLTGRASQALSMERGLLSLSERRGRLHCPNYDSVSLSSLNIYQLQNPALNTLWQRECAIFFNAMILQFYMKALILKAGSF